MKRLIGLIAALPLVACGHFAYAGSASGQAGTLDVTINGCANGAQTTISTTCTGGSGGGAVTNAGTFAVQNTAATPAGANNIGAVNAANTGGTATGIIQGTTSAAITSTAAATTQIIAGSNNKAIYVTNLFLVVSGAGTVNFISGSGSTCGTSTAYLTGQSGHPMSFAANGGIVVPGLSFIIPSASTGLGLCIVTTGSVDTSGSVTYAQY